MRKWPTGQRANQPREACSEEGGAARHRLVECLRRLHQSGRAGRARGSLAVFDDGVQCRFDSVLRRRIREVRRDSQGKCGHFRGLQSGDNFAAHTSTGVLRGRDPSRLVDSRERMRPGHLFSREIDVDTNGLTVRRLSPPSENRHAQGLPIPAEGEGHQAWCEGSDDVEGCGSP